MTDGRRKVWILESGEYSDYRVGCIFEREEDAEAAVAAGLGEDYSERILFAPGVLPVKTRRGWNGAARLDHDGYESAPYAHPHDVHDADELDPKPVELYPERVEVKVHKQQVRVAQNGPYDCLLTARGRDREDVLKALSDRMGRLKAERDGLA
jgi:hypothetical protein